MSAHRWIEARNLLCIRLDSLGDVLMTTPAIRALKQAVPGRRITLLTSKAGASAASLVPEIDDVLVYDPPWMKHTPARYDSAPEFELVAELAHRRFDGAVIFTVCTQNPLPAAMLCYLADIPLRLAHCRENPYQLLTDWVLDTEPASGFRHEVRRQLDLVAAVGAHAVDERMSVAVPPGAIASAAALLAAEGVDLDGPWIAVHPGATAESRRYPPEYFARVVRDLSRLGLQLVLTGDAAERELCTRIARESRTPTVSLAGRLDVPALAGVLACAPLLLANNTGPVHLAAAVGTPVVDIYALTNPQHTPWGVPNRVVMHDVPCRNCLRSVCPEGHHACLRRIEPREVVAATLELLAEIGHPLAERTFAV